MIGGNSSFRPFISNSSRRIIDDTINASYLSDDNQTQ